MPYYFETITKGPFDEAEKRVRDALGKEGFGVLTEIDVQATMKKKLNVDYPRYTILGACNPPFAHKALQAENRIGTMLPCNVIVREESDGSVQVSAVDPIASMQAVDNPDLGGLAQEVAQKLRNVISSL
ncbi:DUF302 domain-containing protein [Salinispira pacifica]